MDVISLFLLAEWRDCVYGIRKHYQAHWWSRIIGRSARDHWGHRPGPSMEAYELRVVILSRKLGLRNLQYIPAGPLRGAVTKRVL